MAEVLGLWLGPAQVDIVFATMDVGILPSTRATASVDAPGGALSPPWLLATLTYILVDGGALDFSESGYRRSLANQTARRGDGALEREGGAVAPTSGSRLGAERREKPTSAAGLSGEDGLSMAATVSLAATASIAGTVSAADTGNTADAVNSLGTAVALDVANVANASAMSQRRRSAEPVVRRGAPTDRREAC